MKQTRARHGLRPASNAQPTQAVKPVGEGKWQPEDHHPPSLAETMTCTEASLPADTPTFMQQPCQSVLPVGHRPAAVSAQRHGRRAPLQAHDRGFAPARCNPCGKAGRRDQLTSSDARETSTWSASNFSSSSAAKWVRRAPISSATSTATQDAPTKRRCHLHRRRRTLGLTPSRAQARDLIICSTSRKPGCWQLRSHSKASISGFTKVTPAWLRRAKARALSAGRRLPQASGTTKTRCPA